MMFDSRDKSTKKNEIDYGRCGTQSRVETLKTKTKNHDYSFSFYAKVYPASLFGQYPGHAHARFPLRKQLENPLL